MNCIKKNCSQKDDSRFTSLATIAFCSNFKCPSASTEEKELDPVLLLINRIRTREAWIQSINWVIVFSCLLVLLKRRITQDAYPFLQCKKMKTDLKTTSLALTLPSFLLSVFYPVSPPYFKLLMQMPNFAFTWKCLKIEWQ